MLFFIPPNINIDNTVTQIKKEFIFEYSVTSTCIQNAYHVIPNDFLAGNWQGDLLSTNIKMEKSNEKNSSTWEELNYNELDLISKLVFTKSYKLKSKIKSITKYNPIIVID